MIDSRKCTVCGRVIPDGEICHFVRDTSEGSVTVSLKCALHTDHETNDNWNRPGEDDG